MIENEEVKKFLHKLATDMQETGETAAYLIEEHCEKKRVGIAGEITMAAHYYNISRAKTIFELIGKHFK